MVRVHGGSSSNRSGTGGSGLPGFRRTARMLLVLAIGLAAPALGAQLATGHTSMAGTVFGDSYDGAGSFSSSRIGFLDNTFVYLAVSGGDGGVEIDGVYGSYVFDRGVVTLTPMTRFRGPGELTAEVVSGVELTLRLEPSTSDLRFAAYLVGVMMGGDGAKSAMRFADRRTGLGLGTMRTVKGVAVELVNRYGVTRDTLNVREGPSVTAPLVKGFHLYPHSVDRYDALPKGTRMHIIARTPEKLTVGSWSNYWYLIRVGEFLKDVWVFGEFLDVTEDSILGDNPAPGSLLDTVLMGFVKEISRLRSGNH